MDYPTADSLPALASPHCLKSLPVCLSPTFLIFYVELPKSLKQVLTIFNPYDFTIRYKVMSTSPNKYIVNDAEGVIAVSCCADLVIRHTMPTEANCDIVDNFRIIISDCQTKQVIGKRVITSMLCHVKKTEKDLPPYNYLSFERRVSDQTLFPIKNAICSQTAHDECTSCSAGTGRRGNAARFAADKKEASSAAHTKTSDASSHNRQTSSVVVSLVHYGIIAVLLTIMCMPIRFADETQPQQSIANIETKEMRVSAQPETSASVYDLLYVTVTVKLVTSYILGVMTVIYLKSIMLDRNV